MRTKVAALAAAAAVLGSVAVSTGPANAAAEDPPFPGITISMSPANGASGTVFDMNFTTTSSGAPVSAACPGDNPAGWFWTAFIVPAGTDIGALTFGASGSPVPPATLPAGQTAAQFRPLATPTGTFLRSQAPGLGDGAITPPAGLWLGNNPLPAGQYQVGVACYDSNNATVNLTGRYYATPITITPSAVVPVTNPQGYNYTFGAVPPPPNLEANGTTPVAYNPVATRPTTATVDFTQAVATPAVTGYTATLTGVDTDGAGPLPLPPPIAPIAVPAGTPPLSFQIPGLDAGETYDVTLVATNSAGNSAPSNTIRVTGDVVGTQPVVTVPAPIEDNGFVASWTVPTPAPASYNVSIAPVAPATLPVGYTASFTGVTGTTQGFAGLKAGSYTVTVTPVYTTPGITATPGASTFAVNPGALVFQELTVTRPAGALILTQRCGVNNALPSVSATAATTPPGQVNATTFGVPNGFPGFPFNLDPTGVDGRVGTAPTRVDANNVPIPGPNAGLDVDANGRDTEFPNYPLPNVTTPTAAPIGNITQCGLEMGVARFVTEFNSPVPGGVDGVATPLAGEFFAASGRLDEVTVLDTRDLDTGWKLKADIEDRFTSIANGDSFSGNYLGMLPVVTDDSDVVGGEAPSTNPYNPVTGPGSDFRPGTLYDQLVSPGYQATAPEAGFRAGGVVLPGDGFPVGGGQDSTPSVNGMTDNPVLASAPAGRGLGIATLDARMLLLIPASVDAADYSATLTLTVAP